MAWVHRITGIILVAYALVHIQTLSMISNSAAYDAKMVFFSSPLFIFLKGMTDSTIMRWLEFKILKPFLSDVSTVFAVLKPACQTGEHF